MNYEIRRMRRGDLKRIAALEREIFTSPWSETSLLAELLNPHSRYLVMESDGDILAYAGCWIIYDEAHVNNVAVAPAMRGRGLGKGIMLALIRLACLEGARSMTLEVRASNHIARGLYQRLGFITRGIRPGYYTDNQEDAEIMWLEDMSEFAEKNA